MIAAQHDGQGACRQDFADRLFGAVAVGGEVFRVAVDVSAIDYLDVAPVEQRSAYVEVIAVESAQRALAQAPDRGRRVRLVVRDLIDRVGVGVGDADDRNVRFERIEVERDGKIMPALKFPARCGGQR